MGEAACGELLAAASLKEPGLQGAHAAAVLWMQPACCLRDAETREHKVSCPCCGQFTAACGSTSAAFIANCEQWGSWGMQGRWQGLSLTPRAVPGCSPESVQGPGEAVGAVYWAGPRSSHSLPVLLGAAMLARCCPANSSCTCVCCAWPSGDLPPGLSERRYSIWGEMMGSTETW